MRFFVVFKSQVGEIKNSYSLVDSEILKTIPKEIILAKKEVEDRLYTTEEMEQLRDEIVKENKK